jgi:hypothetical protein
VTRYYARRVKRFLILLVLLAGGLAAAAFAVPSNAAVVNGVAITQSQLNSDLSAIANSPTVAESHNSLYDCYLNAQQLVSTDGEGPGLPSENGVGTSADSGAHPTVTTAFAASYLDTDIVHQLVSQLAAKRHIVVTASDLATARSQFEAEITSVLQDVTGSAYACATGTEATTGQQVLATMPKSFVDANARFDASVSVLEEQLSGVGSSAADLEGYFDHHRALFATDVFIGATYSTLSDAQAAAAKVAAGTPFATVAGQPQQHTYILYDIATGFPASAKLNSLPVDTLSAPISYDGGYLLLEITSSSPTSYPLAAPSVAQAVQSAGSAATQRAIETAESHAHVSLDPRYGTWSKSSARIAIPISPVADDLVNRSVDAPVAPAPSASTGGSATSSTGQTG